MVPLATTEAAGAVARAGLSTLQQEYPELAALGGCLLLGRCYADPDSQVLFLGINPGLGPSREFDTQAQSHNWLLEGPNPGHAYWTNARKFFNASARIRAIFETATFAFCCPYRSESWSGLSRAQRRTLVRLSQPVLAQILQDCRPSLVVVAGKAGLGALKDIADTDLLLNREYSGSMRVGTYQWCAYDAVYRHQPFLLVQVPHFSRANSAARLRECAAWLESLMGQTA